MRSFYIATVGLLASVVGATLQIVPGATWTATNTGQHIQAHGGGMIKVGSKWYWVGEDKTNGSAFQNINCYSSTNLVEWNYEGALLSRTASGDTGPDRVIERPKVIYNKSTNKYVLWMHIESSNYGDAKIGVAVGDSVCGKYTYLGSSRPLGFQSRDSGAFVDDDGKGYMLTEDRENGLRINLLSNDYTQVVSNVHTWAEKYEAPALIKKNGVYFMFSSQLTGWNANDNMYSTATSLSGPWSAWKKFADSGSNTYSSQTTFVLPIGDNFMYMGDRWVSDNLMRSTYVWLPLQISGTTATMKNAVNWVVDPASGSMTGGPSETQYEGESATLSNGARSISCSTCSNSNAAGYIGGASQGMVVFSNVNSAATTRTTIRIKHLNGDSAQRYADVSVNGKTQRLAFLPHGGGDPASSSLHADLKQGANEIKVAIAGTWGPDVDRLMVPQS
ncbi:carbohydrate-binding module family 35 protein [Dothidotthia symphoricarpi CBS 119687]|uniref:Carbohydrate-binding module family 35 protein n=1 Tax=Dothidotthia symphoricarpi CBS 119687 TaxID=1392245 RepID=A0A6A6AH11_9PLEO|nr:carbohydrate-binding module family 35 protein [Dothidotthia symphoricarpi CBS 119687]KAF2131272.1 carbohydrate-binding module family 35 protein [Dothidotthia symphoricarpi CBS 119687]